MTLEKEVKIGIGNAGEILARCLHLGAEVVQDRLFEDNEVLDFRDLRLKEAGKLVRLRRCGSRCTLTFKGPSRLDSRVKVRQETEISVPQPESLQEILRQIGLKPVFRYQKYRRICRISEAHLAANGSERPGRELEIMIDETPIGNFIELEGDEDLIHLAAERLGFGPEAFIVETYRELYLGHCRREGRPATHMVFSESGAGSNGSA